MIKKSLLLTLLLAILAPWAAQAQETVTIGEGTVTNYTNPIGTYYNYSITEQLYTAEEIGTAGTISSISFYYMGIAARDLPITVYMANVDAEDLTSGISLAVADQVFSGTLSVPATAGWVTINLTNPYAYDGTSNLLIGFIKDYLYYFSGQSWQGTATTTAMARYTQSDSAGPYTTSTVPGTAQTNRPNIQMVITPSSGPVCEKPETFEVSNVTANSATLTWTGGSGTYNVEYKGGSAADWTAYLTNTTSTSANLTGLTPSTAYQYRVQSVCDGGLTSGWKTMSFTTECEVLTNFPITYGFETSEGFPTNASTPTSNQFGPCWRNEATVQTGSNSNRVWGTSTSSKHTGSQALILPDKGNSSNPAKTMLVFPEMNFTDANGYVVSFWIQRSGSSSNPEGFKVYASDCDTIGPNAVELGHYSRNYGIAYPVVEPTSGWYQYETEPITMTGSVHIIFEGHSYYGNATYVDDIEIKVAPSCFKPTGLAASNVTAHEATITWTSAANDWQICVNDDEENLIDVSDTTYTLTGLAPETAYTVKVRTNCGDEGYSDWTTTVSFTTTIACPVPTIFATSNVGAHSVTLDWTSDASEWVVAYQAAADTTFSEVTVTEKPYVLEGLDPETSYTVKVKAVCGGIDGESQYTTTRSFTTAEACPAPESLTVSNLTVTSATLTWTELGEGTSWFICLDGDEENLIETHETTYTFTELESETVHTAKVKSDCSTNWSSVVEFEPTAKIIIGSGTATSTYLPSNTNYHYSFTQQIYTVAELGDAGVFESIDFYMTSTTAYTRNLDIYMVSTNKNAFESNTDWIAVTAADLVFSGDVDFVPQAWTTITLDNIFIYDGTQNVAIIVDDNTYDYSSRSFRTFTASAQQAIYKYQDGTNIPIDYTGNGTRTTSKNQIRILKSEMSDCMKPTSLTATEVAPNFAKLSWTENGESTEWVVVYNGNTITANTNVDFELTGLESDSVYTIAVYPTCDENLVSTAITITTLVACPTPFDVETVNIGHDNATVAWTGYSDNYNVKLGWDGEPTPTLVDFEDGFIPMQFVNDASYAWTIVTADTITYIMCGNQGVNSSTSAISITVTYTEDGTIEFDAECRGEGTSSYYDHCDFYIDNERVLYHGADVTNEGWLHYSFDVAAGEHTFTWSYTKDSSVSSAGDYFAVDNIVLPLPAIVWSEPDAVEDTEYTFTGLTPETPYYVRVQGVCGETETEWSGVTFTTLDVIVWNYPEDWPNDSVPEAYADVTIPANTQVIVPSGYTAYADEITIEEGGSILIENGGQLLHSNAVPVTMLFSVNGYNTGAKDNNPDNDGYILFALPLQKLESGGGYGWYAPVPVSETGMNTGDFDLYYFEQAHTLEWRNFETEEFGFNLGQGYLYANGNDITPTLAGTAVATTNRQENLQYTSDAAFAGWNLLGNPYTATAYIDRPFYVLNNDGDEVENEAHTAGEPIGVFQGFFVKADATGDVCNFSTVPYGGGVGLNMTVNQGRSKKDNAIITFGGGQNLEKFQLNPNHTKVYMAVDGKDYAIVDAPEMGEMPVSFKAETSGTYTLSFSNENVSFGYLRLIDNLTGVETNLLETPNYTFNARTTDYANRFRLVFATSSNDGDSFAYFNNGNLVINNEGQATLQMVDVMGRILRSESINGCASISVKAAPGVYMLRLINGNDVKVQKVIIK